MVTVIAEMEDDYGSLYLKTYAQNVSAAMICSSVVALSLRKTNWRAHITRIDR